MKNKILTFIIGVLVGAIIATGGFLIYNKTIGVNSNQPEMMQKGQPSNGNMEEPPEKPNGDNGEETPEKPDNLNTDTNS